MCSQGKGALEVKGTTPAAAFSLKEEEKKTNGAESKFWTFVTN